MLLLVAVAHIDDYALGILGRGDEFVFQGHLHVGHAPDRSAQDRLDPGLVAGVVGRPGERIGRRHVPAALDHLPVGAEILGVAERRDVRGKLVGDADALENAHGVVVEADRARLREYRCGLLEYADLQTLAPQQAC